MIAGRALLAAIAALATFGLGACSGPVAPVPSPSQSAAPDTTAAVVTLTASEVAVTTIAGVVLDSFDYFAKVDTAVATLTDTFGSEPSIEQVTGHEEPGYTSYDWSGFQLQVLDEAADDYPPLRITVVVTSVGDILIATIDGVSVGASADAVAEAHASTTQTFTLQDGTRLYAIRLDERTISGPSGDTFEVYVGLGAKVGGPVTSIAAPQLSLGV